MTLGERIKERRQNARLSQEKVAELVGVSRQAVTKWEADQTAPNTENLFKLAEIFGTTVDMLISSDETSKQSPAEQIYYLYKMEEEKKATEHALKRKKNLKMTLAVMAAYLLVYLVGRVICGDFAHSSFLGWLTGTDSKYYLFGWLTHQGLFWIAMMISALPALFGKYRFSVMTFAAFVLGIFAGELFGPNPAGAATGHTHYGWLIWSGIFSAAIIIGAVWELLIKRQAPKKQRTGA